jgi:hypothetical protein
MTENAANIAVSNQALGLLGATAIVLNGSSTNHGFCTTFFDASRDEVLVAHPWNWARKRAYAIQTTDPLFGPDNAFTVPSDCLRILTIEDDPLAAWSREGGSILTDEGNSPSDYDDDGVDYLAGEYISSDDSGSTLTYLVDTAFTSSSETSDLATYCTSQGDDLEIIGIEYIYQVTDVSTYPAYMNQCLVLNLAINLSSPIIQGAATQLTLNLQTMLHGGPKTWGVMSLARSIDAQEAGGEIITTDKFLDARK